MLAGNQQGGPLGLLKTLGKESEGKIDRKVLLKLAVFLKPYRKQMVLAGVLMILATAAALLIPYMTRVIIDLIKSGNKTGIFAAGGIVLGAIALSFAANLGERFLLSRMGQQVLNDLRNKLFEHIQRLGAAYHDSHIIGITISRVINDVSVINSLLTDGLIQMSGDIIIIAGTIAMMLWMNWMLALFCFAVIPLMLLATWLFSLKAKQAFRETREKLGAVIGDFSENISGIRVTQAFNQEANIYRQFKEKNRENKDANIRAVSLSFLFIPAVDFLSVLAVCIVLGVGGWLISAHNAVVTTGVLVAFMAYVNQFFSPIRELTQIYTTLQTASAGGERILELLETTPAVHDKPGATDYYQIRGRVEFQNIGFSYTPDREILKNINLHAEPGETVALVGQTGAGKTTIVNLICRFYPLKTGRILIDSRDIESISLKSLHAQMGFVSQDPFLFPGTIEDNIKFGAPHKTRDQVIEAARKAQIHSYIEHLELGYKTFVLEGSVNLSVGQRQLLAIARAILVDPKILIMDEATSSVDTVTEKHIQLALEELLKGRTSIVIAHRLSTIINAQRIYVLDCGAVKEAGTHAELVRQGGIYKNLYDKQFVNL